eukprot:1936046-Amphidinium_carterae.1
MIYIGLVCAASTGGNNGVHALRYGRPPQCQTGWSQCVNPLQHWRGAACSSTREGLTMRLVMSGMDVFSGLTWNDCLGHPSW